jgi:hypothetical protein
MRSLLSTCVLVLSIPIAPLSALAQDEENGELQGGVQPRSEAPDPLDRWDIAAWDHFEISMGFIAGEQSLAGTAFEHRGGATPGAAELSQPFAERPFAHHTSLGLRYDVRLVVAYTRMTIGVDFPFAQFAPSDGTYAVGGVDRAVSVRSINPYLLHFGIGGEIPIGPIAPFLDLLGHVRWTEAALSIDGERNVYGSTGFLFSARAGLRLHVRRWFYASVAGEIGIAPAITWQTEVSVGFAIM